MTLRTSYCTVPSAIWQIFFNFLMILRLIARCKNMKNMKNISYCTSTSELSHRHQNIGDHRSGKLKKAITFLLKINIYIIAAVLVSTHLEATASFQRSFSFNVKTYCAVIEIHALFFWEKIKRLVKIYTDDLVI